jgi:hypothetical protein
MGEVLLEVMRSAGESQRGKLVGKQVLLPHDLEAIERVNDARLALTGFKVAIRERNIEVFRHDAGGPCAQGDHG